jgi:hypothetical protein
MNLIIRNKYIYPIKRTFDTAHKDDHEDFKRIQQTKRVLAEEDEVCKNVIHFSNPNSL